MAFFANRGELYHFRIYGARPYDMCRIGRVLCVASFSRPRIVRFRVAVFFKITKILPLL